MPPYQGYGQPDYGGYPVYGQPQMSQAPQNQMPFAVPQQQQHPTVVIPSSHRTAAPQPMRPQAWPQPQVNYAQQPTPTPHQYHQHYTQGQQYPASSPLQQFAPGQFSTPPQQQYRHPASQGQAYQAPYQPPQQQRHQQHPAPTRHPTSRSQPAGGSVAPAILDERSKTGQQQRHAPVNQPRPQPRAPSRPSPRPLNPQAQPGSCAPGPPTAPRPNPQASYTMHAQSARPIEQEHETPKRDPSSSATGPTTYQRTAHVHIPRRPSSDMHPTPQSRSPKRRRSNEGATIHVSQSPMLPPSSAPKRAVRPPESSPLSELHSSQVPPPPSPGLDYQSALLSLSDEYIDAAHSMSAFLASGDATEEHYEQYHKLLATGMGCLESMLKNYRLPDPRKEARIRLRLASLLHEETENGMEAEELLTKGIALCDRNRVVDAKYAMHHLQVRILFKSSPKAAFKLVEKLVSETEALQIFYWAYAFRFLRVSLSMHPDGPSDTPALLRHLTALAEQADTQLQIAVQIAAATLETLVHLRSGNTDAIELAQRSLAAARTHQLGSEMNALPQFRATLDCLDLACCLMQYKPEQAMEKMNQLQANMDAITKSVGWIKDGTFLVPLGFAVSPDIEANTGGIFRTTPTGGTALSFRWLSRSQLYMIGYVLSGCAMLKENSEKRMAETFFQEGVKLSNLATENLGMSVSAVRAIQNVQKQASLAARLLVVFAYCGRAAWHEAEEAIISLRTELSDSDYGHDGLTDSILLYLAGTCKQGLGQLEQALGLYRDRSLHFDPHTKSTSAIQDIRALAAMNSVLIIRTTTSDSLSKTDTILDSLESYCLRHPNSSMQSVYYLLRAHTGEKDNAIIKIKQHLQNALRPAQVVKNIQLLSIIMNTMTESYFTNIVGKQALQSANAGHSLAVKGKNPLWIAVADIMYRDTLERGGDGNAAAAMDAKAKMEVQKLPEAVREKLGV